MSEVAIGICTVLAFPVGLILAYNAGKRDGVTQEWNRINDAKLEKDRLRRLRDGRTREHKRAMKGQTK